MRFAVVVAALTVLATHARAQGTCLAARDPSDPDENVTKRVVSSEVVLGKATGAPTLAATAERAADGTAEVVVTCTVSMEKLRRDQVEITAEGPWPLYTGVAVLALAGGVASGVGFAALAATSAERGKREFFTAFAGIGVLTGAFFGGGAGLLALGSAPYTTAEQRTKSVGLVDAPCPVATEVNLYAGAWSDEGETDAEGVVRFFVPPEVQRATATFASSAHGNSRAAVEIPPRVKSWAEMRAEAEAESQRAAEHAAPARRKELLAQEDGGRAATSASADLVPTLTVSRESVDEDLLVAVSADGLQLAVSVAQRCARGPCPPSTGASVQLTTWSGAGSTSVQTDSDGQAVLTIPPEAVAASTDAQPWARLGIRTSNMGEALFQVEPNEGAYAAALENTADLRAFEAFSRRFPDHPLPPAAQARRDTIIRDSAADLEKRRANATAAWKRTKAKTPAALDDIVAAYGKDALTPELTAERERLNAKRERVEAAAAEKRARAEAVDAKKREEAETIARRNMMRKAPGLVGVHYAGERHKWPSGYCGIGSAVARITIAYDGSVRSEHGRVNPETLEFEPYAAGYRDGCGKTYSAVIDSITTERVGLGGTSLEIRLRGEIAVGVCTEGAIRVVSSEPIGLRCLMAAPGGRTFWSDSVWYLYDGPGIVAALGMRGAR